MDPEISIVTSYFNRRPQFLKTVEVLEKHPLKEKIELVVVDDASEDEHRLEEHLNTSFESLLIRVDPAHKTYKNPCVPYNLAVRHARGEKIILQNPECLHAGDLITAALNLKENDYLSFHCYSFGQIATETLLKKDLSNLSFAQVSSAIMQTISAMPQRSVDHSWPERGESWFNHVIFRPTAFHFASAINKKDWDNLNGFDERFAHGIGWDDTEFIARVKRKMNIKFCPEVAVHLHHPEYNFVTEDSLELYQKNENLYKEVLSDGTYWRAPNPTIDDREILEH